MNFILDNPIEMDYIKSCRKAKEKNREEERRREMPIQKLQITLEACRVNAGKTQPEWAEILDVSTTTVCNWESGKSEPPLSKIRIISDVSGIPMDYIFCNKNPIKMN